ncbi:MAG: hypothetical protein LBH50_04445 [Spirochaetaceae bacterium]|jgi:hypothetical protein|nr:hypothetical protein [Spirochaetaceae bacterium]
MKRLFYGILFPLFVASGGVFAIEWPSKDATLISNFGESYMGNPMLGDIFSAKDALGAIEKGEIIFTRGVSAPASRFTSPLGVTAVIDHGDGLLSIYSRAGKLLNGERNQVNAGETIAEAGTSGWSGESGFRLSIFDRHDRRWVNPSFVIPGLPDTRPPSIRSVRLKGGDGRMFDLASARSVRQGSYAIIVHAVDPGADSGTALAPARIICSVNGVETGAIAFDAFSARDGVLMMFSNGLVPVFQIYSNAPAVEVCEVFLSRGRVTLEIIVQDAAAVTASGVSQSNVSNSRRAVYSLSVE